MDERLNLVQHFSKKSVIMLDENPGLSGMTLVSFRRPDGNFEDATGSFKPRVLDNVRKKINASYSGKNVRDVPYVWGEISYKEVSVHEEVCEIRRPEPVEQPPRIVEGAFGIRHLVGT